ncbi:hypothetical protein [Bacteroides sp. 51]|uniref:hypothetical protein n=1 Tax=Bacteroides sp. 51 TaxID=2302938 RepID=UPI0013D0766C|nr:hypothetical protein [Bacteroides sp. 51]NDV84474.1 hypothetical protein [Bacteroides sp. 51]
MKKLVILSFVSLLLVSCGDGTEKKAAQKLQSALQAFDAGDFNLAKTEIDSIKILYPKAFNARKEGVKLMQQVELAEQKQTVAYLDSILSSKQADFEAIKSKFVLEKDTAYQEIGNYFWPTQTVEKNLHRSYLRFQVNERGVMSMTSIYCGSSNIHHLAVKVIAPDGTFAETPASNDSYETTNLGEKIEKADYLLGQDGNVMGFIYFNHDKNLKVECLGGKKYTTTMSASDRQALKETYELSQILSAIEQAKKEKEEANLKIGFISRKIEEDQKANLSE